MNTEEIKQTEKQHIMQNYGRYPIVIDKGEGCVVFDKEGKRYLDFLGGVATCVVGHANKEVTEAITRQAEKLIGISNWYYTEQQVVLAKKLSELSDLQKCFFCNSGTEANEAAIKLAKKVTGKKEFIAFEQGFHGRTTGALAATWKQNYRELFSPLAPKVAFVKYGDARAVKSAISENTAGVIVESIQGEGGVIVPPKEFLYELRKICTEHKILLIVDEVQTGMGRTGSFFAFQNSEYQEKNKWLPDIITLAKGLANGVPIGVCMSNNEFAPGDHGSTFGGNNLAAAAALATIEVIEKNNLIKQAREKGIYFQDQLNGLKQKKSCIKEVRGKGLMIAMEFEKPVAKEIVFNAMEKGLLCNATSETVVRFLPALIVEKTEIDEAVAILESVLKQK